MADVPLTVVGAGVVGLAVAARLAPRVPDLVVLERRERHGQETSSRNSEVVHAGIYYAPGSLKARLCVRGNALLYELCGRLGVPHRRLGKLIVATQEQELPVLERLLETGRRNGAELRLIPGEEARALEPDVPARAALLSPSSGIVSAHGLMDALLQQARAHGALLRTGGELVGIERRADGYALTVRHGNQTEAFTSERLVNAAGLECDTVASLAGIDVEAAGYRLRYCKGSYFAVSPARAGRLRHLVYPVPGSVSLGVHAVLGLDGRLRFGPDAEFLDGRALDYGVAEGKRAAFGAAVRRLVPGVRDEDLEPDIAGIRPKLQGPGEPARDFAIREESERGLPGLVNLIGIESPGLTAALAIAEHVEEKIG
jgi:L-2-hydroxyglutarate oxidase LhgO